MALIGYCETCREPMYDWRRHVCPPAWLCWESGGMFDESPEDGGKVVYARDAQAAAEEYVEWSDSQGDYVCIGGDDLQITVRYVATGKEETFVVTGHMTPVYTATRKGEEDAGDSQEE